MALQRHAANPGRHARMNLQLEPAERAFREEVRAFLHANLEDSLRRGQALTRVMTASRAVRTSK